jgi:hypothetical protein
MSAGSSVLWQLASLGKSLLTWLMHPLIGGKACRRCGPVGLPPPHSVPTIYSGAKETTDSLSATRGFRLTSTSRLFN